MRQYFRLALVAPLRSPLLSALPLTARLPMGKHCVVPFLGGMVHARTSSGTAAATSTPPTHPTVDAEVRAQEAELRKAVLRKAEAEARKADIEAEKAEATADIELGAAKAKAEAEARRADIEAEKAEATADIELGAAKARAEMDAAMAKIVLEEAVIKAGTSKAKAEADAANAKAEIEAAKARAEAEARKADIEADKAQAEAEAAIITFWAMVASLFAGAAGAVFLFADFLWQEDEYFIRLRIERKLRSCTLPAFIPSELDEKERLATDQDPVVLAKLPTLMVGPTGSGKSTQLMDLARHHLKQKTPTFILKLRLAKPNFAEKTKDAAQTTAAAAHALTSQVATSEDYGLDEMAHQLFAQIGYPARRSYLGRLLGGGTFKAIGNEFTLPETTNRMEHAVRLLFEVAATLSAERRRSPKPEERTMPVLLFDEVQDLIKSSRLGDAGGRRVLDRLCMEIVKHCVDTHQLRVAVAVNSAHLIREFPSPAKSTRWNYYYQQDPSPEVLSAELVRRGYTKEAAERMIAVCGTRLRLFSDLLVQKLADNKSISDPTSSSSTNNKSSSTPSSTNDGSSNPSLVHYKPLTEQQFVDNSIEIAMRDFDEELSKLGSEGAKRLTMLLDRIWEGSQPNPSLRDLDALTKNPAELTRVIYVDPLYQLRFQSQLHRHVWGLRKRK